MTNFVLTPTRTWDSATSAYRTPRTMLDQLELRAYTLRANGTLRHLDLAPLGSTRRETAEYISERLDSGATVSAVGHELHVSVATVRRFLLSLELTESIEQDEWDNLYFGTDGEPVWSGASEEVTTDELAGDCGWARCAIHGSGNDIAASEECPGPGADLDLMDKLIDSLAMNS